MAAESFAEAGCAVNPFWPPAASRSLVWLGGAAALAYFKKPEGATVLAVRGDAIGWLGAGLGLAGLAGHVWSNVGLARGENQQAGAADALVTDGPFQYVRNPIYLAGIALVLGVSLLYAPWRAADLAAPILLLVFFHVRVVRLEEPALRRRFGPAYDEYCQRVARWVPRR
jgi:protein-S-isoprenylcysteine O-methyltransferase Ste14